MGQTVPDPGIVMTPEPPVVAAAGGGPAFTVVLSDGRGLLTMGEQPVSPVAAVQELALEIPDLRLPFDLAGGAGRFRNRRCRLVRAALATDLGRLDAAIAAPDRQRALEAAGIIELRLHIAAGALRLSGRAVIGGREAGFTARAVLRATAA